MASNEARQKSISEAKSRPRNNENGTRGSRPVFYFRNKQSPRNSKNEREKIVEKGKKEAQDIKIKAKKNIAKANKFILTEFERAVNA